MKVSFNDKVSIIGVAFDKGAGTPGVALGPSAIRYAGLKNRIEKIGYEVSDEGDILNSKEVKSGDAVDGLKNLYEVIDINGKICDKVYEILESGRFPLILGGDHSIAIGTVKGALKKNRNLGLIWFDAHGDINTHETSPSGNIHGMSVAALLGIAHEKLNNIGDKDLLVKPENLVYVAARDLDKGERELFKKLGIKVFTMNDIDVHGIEKVTKMALEIASKNTDAIHLSFDVDGVDPIFIQGTGTKVPGGVNYREANLFLEILAEEEKIKSADFVEVNPLLDDRNKTAEMTAIFIGSFMGEWLI